MTPNVDCYSMGAVPHLNAETLKPQNSLRIGNLGACEGSLCESDEEVRTLGPIWTYFDWLAVKELNLTCSNEDIQ